MYKMILAAVAVAVPLTLSALPASAAAPTGFGSRLQNAEPGGYLAVLTQAQTNRLDRACTVALRGGSSSPSIEFCLQLKDEIEVAEADDSSN